MESYLNSAKLLALLVSLIALAAGAAQAQTDNQELIAKGQYIFSLAAGCACHSDPKGTPHAGVAQDDLKGFIVVLRTLKAVRKPTPELQTSVPMFRSVAAEGWLKAFGQFFTSPSTAPKSGIERGKYLAEHVAICGDCHTPRSSIGVPNRSMYMAGAGKDIGPLGELVPNITPDKETGIGTWKREEIADLLLTGTKPDLDYVRGLMYDAIQGTSHGYRQMSREDALAIADYIKSIPAIKNKVK